MPLDQVMAAHELRLLTSGVVGTAAELATLLRSCGYDAKRKTICEWRRRGRDQVMAAHELRLLTSGVVGTAAELATLLRSCGYDAKRKTICEWRRRGRIAPVAESEQGPVYALADVIRRLV